jgi:hypothetical protein
LPPAQQDATGDWLPIIPLCGTAKTPISRVPREKMTCADVNTILDLIMVRFKALMSPLLAAIPSAWLRWFLLLGQPVIRGLARTPLRNTIVKQLGDSYEAQ